jgi:hypothetical protein
MYNELKIVEFLSKKIGKNFDDFVLAYRQKIEADTYPEERPDLDPLNWEGTGPAPKARSMIADLKNRGHLDELPLYLVYYWLDEAKGHPDSLFEFDLPEQLCIGAQELLESRSSRTLAFASFKQLAELSEEFRAAWEQIPPGALDRVPSLGSTKTTAELIDHFRECCLLADAATQYREAHQWVKARAAYIDLQQFQPGYLDADAWVECLDPLEQVEGLQRVIDAAQAGFVHPNRLPWPDEFPYHFFQSHDPAINPQTSMNRLQEALVRLESRERRSHYESLLQEEERLFIDAFLFPIWPTQDEAYELEQAFLADCRLPDPAFLRQRFSDNVAALILFLTGQPAEASAIWDEQQRRRPRSGLLAHCQGLLHLGLAHNTSELSDQLYHWRLAICHWSVALADEVYWRDWGEEHYKYYERDFLLTPVRNLAQRLQNHLGGLIQAKRRRLTEEGQSEPAAAYEQLYQEFLIEFKAVQLLSYLGGITVEQKRLAWFGPLGARYFGWEEYVANYIANVIPDPNLFDRLPGDLTADTVMLRLRWYFSVLGKVAVLVDSPTPDSQRALRLLKAAEAYQSSTPSLQENPAYVAINDPHSQMREDALSLEIEIRLQLARAQLDRGTIRDPDGLQNSWAAALQLAAQIGQEDDVRVRIRTAILEEAGLPSDRVPLAQLNAAIALLELGRSILPNDPTLKSRLAEFLAERSAIHLRPPDRHWAAAEEDLRRALAIAPHLVNVRKQLALTLFIQAGEIIHRDTDGYYMALDLFRQAKELIQDGMNNYPGFDYSDVLGLIDKTLDNLAQSPEPPNAPTHLLNRIDPETLSSGAQLYAKGIRYLREGQFSSAIDTLSEAIVKMPTDSDRSTKAMLEKAMAEAVLGMAYSSGSYSEGLDLLDEWIPRLTSQTTLPHQREFFRHWPQLRGYLQELDMVYSISEYREILLPFEVPGSDVRFVHLSVEKDLFLPTMERNGAAPREEERKTVDGLCLEAALPPFSGAQTETILENLLLASTEMMLFKVCDPGGTELVLRGYVPFIALNPNRFLETARSIHEYAQVPPARLGQPEELRRWFKEKRAALIQDLETSRDQLLVASRFVEGWCREQGRECTELTTVHYQIGASCGRVEMEAWQEGVRLSARLGELRQDLNIFRRIASLNAQPGIGKLALSADRSVLFIAELPLLDKNVADAAVAYFETRVPELRSTLV